MREYKFRAWGYNKMFKPVTIEHMCGCMPRMDLTNLILMQYTGLKDKNGIEIYEGDIITWNTGFNDSVIFENGMFTIPGRKGDVYWKACEVIGNIYSNPNLLEEK